MVPVSWYFDDELPKALSTCSPSLVFQKLTDSRHSYAPLMTKKDTLFLVWAVHFTHCAQTHILCGCFITTTHTHSTVTFTQVALMVRQTYICRCNTTESVSPTPTTPTYLRHLLKRNFKSSLWVNHEGEKRAIDSGLTPVPPLHTQINLLHILPACCLEIVPHFTIVLQKHNIHKMCSQQI